MFLSLQVMECNGSIFTNKYSEGLPGKRYYGGNEFIDSMESLCQARALAAFGLDAKEWGVNVQPYSGSPANFAVYTALLKPHDRIMGLDLPSGGHLTHGFYTSKKKISATSIFFESLPYQVSGETGLIDYETLEKQAKLFQPKMIICGASAYPRDWDYERLRKIANGVGAFLLTDMAHTSGLVASKCLKSPFEYSHVVTTTTHKSLRGPRGAMIFYRLGARKEGEKGVKFSDLKSAIDFSVFPSLQGGPHNNTIAGIACQLREVNTNQFKAYSKQVVKNCQSMAARLMKKGYKLVTDGTDNHLILWDLRPLKLTGSKMETICDLCHITLNKNTVFGDKSAISPGGVRIGTPALTTRGFRESDFETVAEFLHEACQIAIEVQAKLWEEKATKSMKEFKLALKGNEKIEALRTKVHKLATTFPLPGVNPKNLATQA